MRTLSELTVKDVVYSVTTDEITSWKIDAIKSTGFVTILDRKGNSSQYEGLSDSTVLIIKYGYDYMPKCVYTDLEAAQLTQIEQRREAVDEAKKQVIAAQNHYFELVDRYKGTVCEKEITYENSAI